MPLITAFHHDDIYVIKQQVHFPAYVKLAISLRFHCVPCTCNRRAMCRLCKQGFGVGIVRFFYQYSHKSQCLRPICAGYTAVCGFILNLYIDYYKSNVQTLYITSYSRCLFYEVFVYQGNFVIFYCS